ncbi:hypothetical protein COCCADRAFT_93684, partial [Bipolaris zeicola 26-R-13]
TPTMRSNRTRPPSPPRYLHPISTQAHPYALPADITPTTKLRHFFGLAQHSPNSNQ